MKSVVLFVLFFFAANLSLSGQTISVSVPHQPEPSQKYLFYLHGRIVQDQGVQAVSPEYGPYEYLAILDTLIHHGFHVISEPRPKGTVMAEYAEIVAAQVDTLLKAGVPPENISVVGASMGSGIATFTAIKVKNEKVNYVVMAMCNDDVINYHKENNTAICGNFLSIYESSDATTSCNQLFLNRNCVSGYQEIKLNMNNRHGFIYKPYKEWVHPVVQWINRKK